VRDGLFMGASVLRVGKLTDLMITVR